MNALALWIPGSLLIIIGVLLLAFGQLPPTPALAIVGIGIAVETVGVVLWVRQRPPPNRPKESG
jgi:hypothetical protein